MEALPLDSDPKAELATEKWRANVFLGLASPSRVALTMELAKGEARVVDLARETGLTRANASHQLGRLWDSGLVARERRGIEVRYRLVPGVAELLQIGDQILERAAATDGTSPRPGRRASRP